MKASERVDPLWRLVREGGPCVETSERVDPVWKLVRGSNNIFKNGKSQSRRDQKGATRIITAVKGDLSCLGFTTDFYWTTGLLMEQENHS